MVTVTAQRAVNFTKLSFPDAEALAIFDFISAGSLSLGTGRHLVTMVGPFKIDKSDDLVRNIAISDANNSQLLKIGKLGDLR